MIDLRRIIGYKSGCMLETLVNSSLLVYNLVTSENGYSFPIIIGEQDNQQERLVIKMLKISDDYFIGFVEGEGMFYIGVVPSKETTSGWQVIYFFKVSQNPTGKVVLDSLKKRLDCGYIKQNSKTDPIDKSLALVVRNFRDLKTKVLPFFRDKLIIKKKSFEAFEKVLLLIEKGEHFKKEGLNRIIDLAYSMNTGKRKLTKEYILEHYKN
jgi:hypothetical protein